MAEKTQKLDNESGQILQTINISTLSGGEETNTTANLVDYCSNKKEKNKGKMSENTFFRRFKELKDGDFLASKTNSKHEIIWVLNNKGKEALQHYIIETLRPLSEKKRKIEEQKFIKTLPQKKGWQDLEISLDNEMFIYTLVNIFTFLNKPSFIKFRFKIDQQKLKEATKNGFLNL